MLSARLGGHPRCSCRVGLGRRAGVTPRSVFPARPPNRTCASPRIRLSTISGRCCARCRRWTRPWCGDASAPVTVAVDCDRLCPEQFDVAIANLPIGEKAAAHGSPVQADVPFTYPGHDPPEGVMVEVTEGTLGDTVPEVVAPAS